MQRTATQIMFPDAGDPNIPSLKKSNVTITGDIHNVYSARQQLVVSRYVYTSGFFPPRPSSIYIKLIPNFIFSLSKRALLLHILFFFSLYERFYFFRVILSRYLKFLFTLFF